MKTLLKYYYNMCSFSIGTIAIGVEISITLNIFTILLLTFYNNFNNQFAVLNLADTLGGLAQKVLVGSVLVGLVSDIVHKLEDALKQNN
ncbi:MAG TPA: hypothetical protein GXX17_03760 [Clostridiales bacterium]|nr:hypothetical protein [Clostridiales bacterium]